MAGAINVERDEAYVAYAATLPVYFAFSSTLNLVKIGFSSNVRQRLATLPSDRRDAGRMMLVGWAIGGPQLEAELHDRFADACDSGEWFRPVPEMADFIDEEGGEGEPPIVTGEFRVSDRGYWAARTRLASMTLVERTVVDFGDGRALRASVIVPIDEVAARRITAPVAS